MTNQSKSRLQLLDELSEEEMYYINEYSGCTQLSEIGAKTAIILTKLFQGMHHIPKSQIEKMNWEHDRFLSFTYGGSMATFDGNMLTRLVILAHEYKVRVEITPCNFKYFTINFHNRINRNGRYYERHPTVKDAGLDKVEVIQ